MAKILVVEDDATTNDIVFHLRKGRLQEQIP